jgi:carbamoyl-phosphate synthase / aspartate carbamoyltransferase / dihydroorotase
VLVRAAFTLGGLGSGFANTKAELREIATQALNHSEQILIDKSVRGWKEVRNKILNYS